MENRNRKLHLLGKLSLSKVKIMQKLHPLHVKENAVFLFVDYCFHEFKPGSIFDIILKEEDKTWNHDYKVKLEKVFDEFGRVFSAIPEGYKTICLFECMPSIPTAIKSLPVLKTWASSGKSIYIYNHADINLYQDPANDTAIFKTLTEVIKMSLRKRKKTLFTIHDIEELLPKESSNLVISNMLNSGAIKQHNDKLMLAD